MKILFVCSGNSSRGITPIVKNQGDSISQCAGIELEYFAIKGKGLKGYLGNVKSLRKRIKEGSYDIVHAHYSLSGFLASFAGANPLIVSLMGSDVKASPLYKFLIKLFFFVFGWKALIVKSEDMKVSAGIKKAIVLPNGVDLDKFKPLDRVECVNSLGWSEHKQHVLFAANPIRYEKNYLLAEKAFQKLNLGDVELHCLVDVPNESIPFYLNAADVVLLTSLWEGSPNVIKEAMACNRPIVSTNVGDVEFLLEGVGGCYVVNFDADECASKLRKALEYSETEKTNDGRGRLNTLGLESKTVCKRIIGIYGKQN